MKTISSIKGLRELKPNLAEFILGTCPWITEEWSAEDFGFIFVLEESDRDKVTSVCTVPQKHLLRVSSHCSLLFNEKTRKYYQSSGILKMQQQRFVWELFLMHKRDRASDDDPTPV